MRTIGPAILMAIGPALLALALVFAACTKAAAPVSVPSPTATLAAASAPAASPTLIGVASPAPKEAPATFFLEIVSPKDEIVVQNASVLVQGRTVPDAVVSVDGQPVEVDGGGNFSATITLEQGPNSIEVIASDFSGNQQSRVISLVYAG